MTAPCHSVRTTSRNGQEDNAKPQPHPGRFSFWTEESFEAAAAVWLIRNPPQPTELSDVDLQTVEEGRNKVQTEAILSTRQKADDLHSLLYSDCKEAANRFRTYLWPNGFSANKEKQRKIISFNENSHCTLIPICIHAVEKARHQIALYMPIRLTYEWVIREDGSNAWRRMHVERTAFGLEQIDLKVIHLRPCENGYSKNYGFPHTKDYVRDGFVDFFWLKGSQLGERFIDSPFAIPERFYEEEKYLTFWRKNPTAPWPTDPAELLKLYKMMWDVMDLQIKSDEVKDSGYFPDGDSGYVIAEGDAKSSLQAAAAFSHFYEVELIEEVVSDEVAQEVFTEDLKNKIAFAEAMKR